MQDFQPLPGRIFGGGGGGPGAAEIRRLVGGYPASMAAAAAQQQQLQPQPVKCPRCDSTNTKFCYYNNYNLAQPRHFCKSCRRYWTKGGLLRNVPVGGGCRKSKRTSSSSSRSSAGAALHKDPTPRRSSPAADAYTSVSLPNSVLLVTNSDTGSIPTNSFEPAAGMEAPLVQAAEIFADTTAVASNTTGLISAVPAPMFSNFSRPPPIPLRHQTAVEDIGTGTQPAFMEQVAPLIALQLQSTAAEEVDVQPGLIEQAVPPVPLQLRSEAGDETGVPPVFIDQAAPHIPLQLQPAAGEEVGAPPGFMNPAVSAASGIEWSCPAVDPALFGLSAAAYWGNGHWDDADPALYLP